EPPPRTAWREARGLLPPQRGRGNIRGRESARERAWVPSGDGFSGPENLPAEILKPSRPRYQLPVDLKRPLTEQLAELTAAFEERYLRRALKRTRSHIGRTARLTGLSRRTITDKIALYQIDKSEFKKED